LLCERGKARDAEEPDDGQPTKKSSECSFFQGTFPAQCLIGFLCDLSMAIAPLREVSNEQYRFTQRRKEHQKAQREFQTDPFARLPFRQFRG
jgi:hypothetical protein